jgi:hypothetical protein
MDPARAADILSQALLAAPKNPSAQRALAEGLSAVAARMDPARAAQACSHAADILSQALLAEQKGPDAQKVLAEGLSMMAPWIGFDQADRTCSRVIQLLSKAMAKTNRHETQAGITRALVAFSSYSNRAERLAHSTSLVSSIGTFAGPRSPLASFALVIPALAPHPCRFSTPELVELLKQPLCFGPTRRVFLNHLAFRYQRLFIDHWDFIRFAREHDLRDDAGRPLDFRSLPR